MMQEQSFCAVWSKNVGNILTFEVTDLLQHSCLIYLSSWQNFILLKGFPVIHVWKWSTSADAYQQWEERRKISGESFAFGLDQTRGREDAVSRNLNWKPLHCTSPSFIEVPSMRPAGDAIKTSQMNWPPTSRAGIFLQVREKHTVGRLSPPGLHASHTACFPFFIASIHTKSGGVNIVISVVNELRPFLLLLLLGCPLMTALLFYTTGFSPSFPSVFLRNWMPVFPPGGRDSTGAASVAWVRGHPSPQVVDPPRVLPAPGKRCTPRGLQWKTAVILWASWCTHTRRGANRALMDEYSRRKRCRRRRERERGPL